MTRGRYFLEILFTLSNHLENFNFSNFTDDNYMPCNVYSRIWVFIVSININVEFHDCIYNCNISGQPKYNVTKAATQTSNADYSYRQMPDICSQMLFLKYCTTIVMTWWLNTLPFMYRLALWIFGKFGEDSIIHIYHNLVIKFPLHGPGLNLGVIVGVISDNRISV